MSTAVERPMATTNNAEASGSRSRSDSIEIIDVDSLDPGGGQPQLPPRNLRRGTSRTDSIWIESDDEGDIEILSTMSLSGHNADRAQSHRQYISPPPPRSSNHRIPPVPAINPRLATRHQRAQLNTLRSLPVFPSAPPPRIETGPIAGPSNAPNAPSPPLEAAPISRHIPALGLGGALISSNNRTQNRAQHMRQYARVAAAARRRNAIDDDDFFANYMESNIQMFFHELAHTSPTDRPEYLWRQRHHFVKQPREKEQYHQHYTHPSKPEPGFTFDFAPADDDENTRTRLFPPTSAEQPIIIDDDDEDTPSSSGPSTSGQSDSSGSGTLNLVLVCAKCLDPLVLNAALAPEEGQFKRVWGLRCGHLIDEKCLNELGRPHEEQVGDKPAPKDRKGKGKAKAVVSPTYGSGDAPTDPQAQAPAEEDATNSIRSRLRSRQNAPASSSTAPLVSPPPPVSSAASFASASYAALSRLTEYIPTPKRRRGPAKKPKIEGEFEWKCPVAECGRVHLSVKIDGVWGPEVDRDFKNVKGIKDEARGAVAVFA
ncbi:hypothetical protein JR316_0006398 [Psilocybe cubensis]|uniref:Uncharacterized protein n=2 Tax=Psilocybe cubensis TaxID=181762 RepID=A0A8H7XMX2_PSICU|nr:hypothetical protein JR316_0006398 [Psilocybe cubensis]KAH9481868.1 hypothetical protein JR316_0006398 [Psilocybe cubensis]